MKLGFFENTPGLAKRGLPVLYQRVSTKSYLMSGFGDKLIKKKTEE